MEKQDGILLESGTNEMELLVVTVEEQLFGINVAKVKSIQKFNPAAVSALPDYPDCILGVLQLRESTIPLIDMATVLKITKSEKDDNQIVIVTEFNNRVNSFRVDSVKRIYRVSWTQFMPICSIIQSEGTFIIGSVTLNGEEVLVLDLEQILATYFPETVIQEIREDIAENAEKINRSNVHLLFAEDSGLIRNSIIRCLKEAGFNDLSVFVDGQYAYEHVSAHRDEYMNYDKPIVLVTDIEMPRMDGLALCNKIKKELNLSKIIVIMFSSLINAQMITKCQSVHADDWVAKPESNELITMLDSFCV
ncbi:MAG: chemotaxis protein [Chitinispirillales bacterium]|jgi:two-component system chemotaxis response regulator CheV|nr:chemotaxis protein [Chitinispirillales bacterium]